MESVRLWLNSKRNYTAGARLYQAFGPDASLKKFFTDDSPSAYKQKRLADEMLLLLNDVVLLEEAIEEKTDEQVKRVAAETTRRSGWSDIPDDIEATLHEKWKPLFKEMQDLCAQLEMVARLGLTDPAMERRAGEMVFRILKLEDMCDEIYEQRNYYKAHKKLPEQKEYGDLVVDPMQIPKALENHKRYVRQYRNKLTKEPDNLDFAKQLQKHKWFVREYKKILNIE